MADSGSPIGVFDSGLGGISVLKELIKIMPREDFIYFGDSINAPYGTKSTEEIKSLSFACVERLLEKGCKAICVACNTATSAAVRELRIKYPELPLVGIEPAIKPAAESKEYPKIIVMATPMTIRSVKFQNLLERFKEKADIIKLPCPGLMDFIENGILSGPQLECFLSQLLFDYLDEEIDGVVLGCTHYTFLRDEIQKTLSKNGERTINVFDGGEGTARELKRRLNEAGLLNPQTSTGIVTIENSDPGHLELAEDLFRR